jgi:lactoylglutathione lyase
MVKLGYTILYVVDVEKSISFYERCFGFQRKFITPEADYGELNTGESILSFASMTLANSNLKDGFIQSTLLNKPFGIELGLITEKIEEVIALSIENGATLVENPIEKPWGQKVGYVRDLDGFLLEICTPI